MTKYLLISDSHLENTILKAILDKHNDCDYILHAGDSCLTLEDPLLNGVDVVKGNHDFENFPIFIVKNGIFLTHGNLYHVYQGLTEIILEAKKHGCTTVVHGHTHIPFCQVIDGIRVINPGSIMFNRGSYGYGTYAIYDTSKDEVHFYHHTNHHCVDDIVVEDGLSLLETIRSLKKKNNS